MDLLPALELASGVVERHGSTLAILTHIRATSDGKAVTLTATNLDTEVRVLVEMAGPKFDACAPSDGFVAAARVAAPALSVGDKSLIVGTDPRFMLAALNANDFPIIKMEKANVAFNLAADQFATDLRTLRPAISTEETRYYLNGIYLHIPGDKLIMTATNGHMLIRLARPIPAGGEALTGSILPRRALAIILAAIEAQSDVKHIALAFEAYKVRLVIGDVTITTKLVDGSYPDYARVIPTQWAGSVKAKATDLSPLCAAAIAFGERKQFIELNFAAEEVRVSSAMGNMTARLPGATEKTLPDRIGFNAGYLRDILLADPEGEFTLSLSGACDPALFACDDAGFTAVLMPVRLS